MVIRFARSAFRHGISEERVRCVVEHCPAPAYPDGPTDEAGKVIFLWADWDGVPLEVAGIELRSGDLVVIHAMRMRKAFRPGYQRLLESTGR